ncbi:unnamed protein product, partial [marine sediment metagenome]
TINVNRDFPARRFDDLSLGWYPDKTVGLKVELVHYPVVANTLEQQLLVPHKRNSRNNPINQTNRAPEATHNINALTTKKQSPYNKLVRQTFLNHDNVPLTLR